MDQRTLEQRRMRRIQPRGRGGINFLRGWGSLVKTRRPTGHRTVPWRAAAGGAGLPQGTPSGEGDQRSGRSHRQDRAGLGRGRGPRRQARRDAWRRRKRLYPVENQNRLGNSSKSKPVSASCGWERMASTPFLSAGTTSNMIGTDQPHKLASTCIWNAGDLPAFLPSSGIARMNELKVQRDTRQAPSCAN